ncbi:MAG: DUF3806 domain-containing protein [Myxococcota bacterium]
MARDDLAALQHALDRGAFDFSAPDDPIAVGLAFGEVLRHEFGYHWVVINDAWGPARALQRDGESETVYPVDMITKRVAEEREIDFLALFSFVETRVRASAQAAKPLAPARDEPSSGEALVQFTSPSPRLQRLGQHLHALIAAIREQAELATVTVRGEHFVVAIDPNAAAGEAESLGVHVAFAGPRAVLVLGASEAALSELSKEGSPRRALVNETRAGIAAAIKRHLDKHPSDASSFPAIDEDAIDRLFPPDA